MGAFIIFDIAFETEKDRKKFEKEYTPTKLVDEDTPSFGVAWTMLRDPILNPIYFMGFMGYEEPKEILNECLRNQIKIKFLAWIPINDKNSSWEKVRGR